MGIAGSVWGHLGAKPDVRAAGNTMVLTFSMASSHRVKKDGQWEKATTWVRVSYFGQRATTLADMLDKGSSVIVRGELFTREYEKDGVKRTSLECKADEIEFFGSKPSGDGAGNQTAGARETARTSSGQRPQGGGGNRGGGQPAARPQDDYAGDYGGGGGDDGDLPF
jgi:single-strand DNA-binding protein